MELQKRTKEEIALIEETVKASNFFFDKRGEKIVKVIGSEIVRDNPEHPYRLIEYQEVVGINPIVLCSRSSKSSLHDFNYYYNTTPIENIEELYLSAEDAMKNGLPEYKEGPDVEMSTEIVAVKSKENLQAMIDSIEDIRMKRSQLKLMINFQLEQIKNKFDIVRRELEGQVSLMNAQVDKIKKVITIIELYVGISEELVQIQSGKASESSVPLSLRQQILFMDEEVGILEDQGIDHRNIEEFDKWLLTDDHYKQIIPEEKCIVVLKPRRHFKVDYKGDSIKDPQDMLTYFLIRNGENFYRIYTANLHVPQRLFPKRKEFQELIEKMNPDLSTYSKWDQEKVEDFTYMYQRMVFFIQGLIDRTEVFRPMETKINLMDVEGSSSMVNLIYDDELCLPPNQLTFREWQSKINKDIEIGSRVVYARGVRYADSRWNSKKRFLREYDKYCTPQYPNDGIYQVVEAVQNLPEWVDGGTSNSHREYRKEKHMCIRYNPGGMVYSWTYCEQRKNNLSFLIYPNNDVEILNYDQIEVSDVEFYLTTRLGRSEYLSYLPLLKTIRKHLLEEQEQEDHFCLMLIGEIEKRGLKCKKGMFVEDVIMNLIDWWKFKNKWKRPINKDDELAMRMIERRLFSETGKKKYFK